jgi:hypothetical protein
MIWAVALLLSSAALNPDVTQDTIQQTICVPGYTKTVRPSTTYTNGVKFKLMREEGIAEDRVHELALDHIIALALGGHPRSLDNLQLLDAHENSRKSRIEVKLQCFVCTGAMPLQQAQDEVVADWRGTYSRYASVKCRR